MNPTMSHAFKKNFLGNSPGWYESAIIAFLVLNPLILYVFGPFVMGWVSNCRVYLYPGYGA